MLISGAASDLSLVRLANWTGRSIVFRNPCGLDRPMARTSDASVEKHGAVDALIVTAVPEECDAVRLVDTGAVPGSKWEEPGPAPAGLELFVRAFQSTAGQLTNLS